MHFLSKNGIEALIEKINYAEGFTGFGLASGRKIYYSKDHLRGKILLIAGGTGKLSAIRSEKNGRRIQMKVNKDMIIGDLLMLDPAIAPILMGSGMHCIGCPSSQGESLEEACFVHGMNVNTLVNTINEYLAHKE